MTPQTIEEMSNETILLEQIAHARSGDKGSHANVGVIAYTDAGYDYLCQKLTEGVVEAFFKPMEPTRVIRYELPGIRGLNFMLHDVLKGGASQSLRTDSQGKVLGLAILELELAAPGHDGLKQMTRDRRRNG